MPQLIADTDFGMADPMFNLTMFREVADYDPAVLMDTPDYRVLDRDRTPQGDVGRIVMQDKRSGRMVYIVEYEERSTPIGRALTQVTVWRDPDSALSQGITSKIFNEVLLPKFGTVISDAEQTKDGERFWRGRMAEAAARGDRVGLVDAQVGSVSWHDPIDRSFPDWIREQDGWGEEPRYQDIRFLVTCHSAQDTPIP